MDICLIGKDILKKIKIFEEYNYNLNNAMTDLEIIDLIGLGIELAGDGSISPFTDEEYNAMTTFLNRLRRQYNYNCEKYISNIE